MLCSLLLTAAATAQCVYFAEDSAASCDQSAMYPGALLVLDQAECLKAALAVPITSSPSATLENVGNWPYGCYVLKISMNDLFLNQNTNAVMSCGDSQVSCVCMTADCAVTDAPPTPAPPVGPTPAPATLPPATLPPATDPPATLPPPTVAPTVAPPTPAPLTQPPATLPPATLAPTDAPPTLSPPTPAPLTNPPATNPPATDPPATNPPPTNPPATDPPATDPPATNPPATNPPATDPPATDPPATNPPATDPPATNPPATNPPATDPPATDPPATPSPPTQPPATLPPATDPPATVVPPTPSPPTPAPDTPAPPTLPPPTGAPDTTVPTTVSPATLPPLTSAPSTTPPTTAAPLTAPPATATPTTGSPPVLSWVTRAPVETASPEREVLIGESAEAIVDDTATYGALTTSVVGVLSGPAAASSAMLVILADSECSARERDLPFPLHPTRMVLRGSQALGAVVGNLAIMVGFLSIMMGVVWLVTKTSCSQISLLGRDPRGLVRFPSCALFVILFLYQGTVVAAFRITFYPPQGQSVEKMGIVALGASTVFLLLATPFWLMRHVKQSVHPESSQGKGYYRTDSITRGPVITFIIGPGEWVSSTRDCLWVLRYQTMIRSFRQQYAHFIFWDFMLLTVIGGLTTLNTNSWVRCGIVRSLCSAANLLTMAFEFYLLPHARMRDNGTDVVMRGLISIALGLLAVGFFSEDQKHVVFEIAPVFFLASLVVLMVKLVLDVITEVWVLFGGRRDRVQEEAWCEAGEHSDSHTPVALATTPPPPSVTPPPYLHNRPYDATNDSFQQYSLQQSSYGSGGVMEEMLIQKSATLFPVSPRVYSQVGSSATLPLGTPLLMPEAAPFVYDEVMTDDERIGADLRYQRSGGGVTDTPSPQSPQRSVQYPVASGSGRSAQDLAGSQLSSGSIRASPAFMSLGSPHGERPMLRSASEDAIRTVDNAFTPKGRGKRKTVIGRRDVYARDYATPPLSSPARAGARRGLVEELTPVFGVSEDLVRVSPLGGVGGSGGGSGGGGGGGGGRGRLSRSPPPFGPRSRSPPPLGSSSQSFPLTPRVRRASHKEI